MPSLKLRRQIRSTLCFALAECSALLWAADVKPADVIAKHLDSIGSAQARKNVKSRAVVGAATYRVLVGGTGAVDGKFQFASEGQKSDFLFKINANGFLGEQFICDGNKTSVAGTYPDKHRSEFGIFVLDEDAVLRENLLGGVWSSGWPLLNLDAHKAKIQSEGTKKVDGRELIAIRYEPKKHTDLNILLYFDPQTYQHVLTTYRATVTSSIGTDGETSTTQQQETRYLLEERFSDFKTSDGLTLPTHYDLRYTAELSNGFTKNIEWEVRATDILNNQSIDPRAFEVK
jgi:hypothetical protein